MALFVVEDFDHHVLRDVVYAFGLFNYTSVVLDSAPLGLYNTFYDVDPRLSDLWEAAGRAKRPRTP